MRKVSMVVFMGLALMLLAGSGWAQGKWIIPYMHQHGASITQGGGVSEVHACQENGAFAGNVGITNRWNPNTAIFGTTNSNGNLRTYFLAPEDPYEYQVASANTVESPDMWWHYDAVLNPECKFAWEVHFRWVNNPASITTQMLTPVYHWDLVRTLNTSTGTVPGYSSDAFVGSNLYQAHWGQTFKVPQGINRIISAKSFGTPGAGCNPFTYIYSIHEGDPNGPQVGPTIVGPMQHDTAFAPNVAHWGINDVPVTPGQTYALRVEKNDAGNPCYKGLNMFWGAADNYADGNCWVSFWPDTTLVPVSDRDLCAVVIGLGVNTGAETPTPTPVPTQACCQGDADKSGFVNGLDYVKVRDYYGNSNPPGGMGDANCDGFVNVVDYRAVRDNFGLPCTQ